MEQRYLNTTRLSTASIHIMLDMMKSASIDPKTAFVKAGIDPQKLNESNTEISGVQELEFQRVFAELTRHISGFWLQTGLKYRLMSYGPLGLAVLAADNIRGGCRVLHNFQSLTYSLMQYTIEWQDNEPTMLVAEDEKVPDELTEFHQERALGSATTFLNDMVQGRFPLTRIETVLDRPNNWMDVRAMFDIPVKFNASKTRWIFAPDIGETALPMGNPLLEETYQRQCLELISQAKVQDGLLDRLYYLLIRESRDPPDAATAAQRLNVSERTLFRKLNKQGLSYGAVLDQIREKRAKELLDQSNLSVEMIAEIVGFSETSSFSRAFKRWTGISPTVHRRQNMPSIALRSVPSSS